MESHKVYIGNLSHSVTEEEIKDIYEEFGDIKSIHLNAGEGFGFIEYGTIEEAESAIHGTHGKEFFGRTLKAEDARQVMHHAPRYR